jgi:hypothetical protein
MATSKSGINPISGLGSIDEIYPAAKEKVDPNVSSLALAPDSAKILANMQKRAAELTSPWHNFQTGLDEMVARTHYDPTQAINTMAQRRANEAAEIQNIGTTMSQVDLFRNQLKGMQDTFGKLSSGQNGGIPGYDVTQINPSKGETFTLGVNGTPIKLTPYDIQNLKHYVDTNDVAGFKEAFKQISNIRGKEMAVTEELWKQPQASEITKQVETLYYKGKPVTAPIELSKLERKLWKEQGVFPQSLADAGYSPRPPEKVQKKATGGIMKPVQEMADGASVTLEGANYQPEMDTQQASVDPMGNFTTSVPAQEYSPRLLEDALAAVTGSGNAQAQPSMSSDTYSRTQQGSIDAGLENLRTINKEKNAELEAIAKTEAQKKAEYQGSPEKAENTYKVLKQLKDNSIGYPHLFNLKGTGLAGPILSAILPEVDASKAGAGNAKSKNDLIAQYTLFNRPEDAAKYSLISSGATIAGTEFAKNLAQEGNSRLTNMDIGVGSQAKGVGPDMPYAAHMENLARNMEEARIMYYRGNAFTEWHKKHPRVPVNEFQNSPEYKDASKKAREDIVNEFKGVPESHKYLEIYKDTNGRKYYVHEGKAKYIKD